MFKIFGILLLSGIPVLMGIEKGRAINTQKQNMEAFLYFVRECRQEIEFQQRSITSVLDRIPSNNYHILEQLISLIKKTSPLEAWEQVSDQLQTDARIIMNDFFNHWGVSDCRSQLHICDITIRQLEQLYLRFSSETVKKTKLYRTIGVLAGFFIAIIFI